MGFRVTDSNGAAVGPSNGTFYTDRAGEIMITGLAPGITVTVSEFKTVDGFILDGTPQNIKIENYQRMELVFWNARKGSLTVRKLDSVTREPLSGVEFQINYANGTPVDTDNGSTSSNGRYFTDRNGEITLNGVHGTVVAYEVATIPGYTIDPDGRSQTVVVNPDDHQTLTFTNTPKQALTVQKLERGTNDPIEGVKFLITDSSGTVLGTENGEFVTDRNGRIVLENLTPGTTITAKETETVSGYVLDPTPQSILIRSGEAQTMSFFNAKKGSLTIEKRDSISGELLPGAVFKVSTLDGEPVNDDEGRNVTCGIYSTDRSGQIILTKLQPDTYVVQEIEAPEGYSLNSEKQTVKVNAEEAPTLTFTNVPLQTVVIQKFVEGTTDPLAGVRFLVTDTAGNPVGGENGEYVTDRNGRILISGVEAGTSLVAREVKTVKGYQLNSMPQTIQVSALNSTAPSTNSAASGTTAGSSNTLTFFDDPLSTLIVKKYIKGTNREPLAGVAFKITDGSGSAIGNTDGVHYTDASGEITIENLAKGTVLTVREVATVDGFILDGTPKQIEIQNSDVHELVFWNERQGGLTIRKLDSATQKPLEGVTFKITTAEGEFVPDQNGHVSSNGLYKTDAAGEIILTGVTGTLVVTETETIPGYTIHEATRSQTVMVKPGDNQELTFYNDPTQTLTIRKLVSGTTDPIQGVRFKVTASDGKVVGSSNGEFLTNESGEIVLTNLIPGTTITATELETVSGFVLDTTPKSIKIESGEAQSLVFYNQKKGGIVIEKRDAQTDALLAGAEFRVTTSGGAPVDADEGRTSTDGIFVTNERGQIVLTNLDPDTYVITEIKAPEGYVLTGEKQTVKVNANDTQTVTFKNQALQSVTIQKLAEGTNKPLAGVTFLVTDANNTPIGSGSYVTDENGQITLTGLTPGMTLIVRETKTVKGYQLNSTPRTIVVGGSTAARSMASSALLSTGGNTQTGTNSITVYDEPLSTLVVTKLAAGSNTPLKGARFLITDSTGKTLGNGTGEFTTDENGRIVLKDLQPGITVTAKEIEAPKGYVLDSTPKSIDIQSGDVQELEFYNSAMGTLTIIKRDRTTNKALKGATFQLTYANGEFVANNGGASGSNGTFTTDSKGQIIIKGLNPSTIIIRETKAPDGYLLDETPVTVEIGADGSQTVEIFNDSTQTLTIQKFITDTTKPIQGVTFLVTDSSGATLGPDNGEYVTDKNGRIVLTGLEPGTTITAKEVKTAKGFVLDTTPQSILIKQGEAQRLTFYNSPEGGLEIVKINAAEKTQRIANVSFEIRKMDGGLVRTVTTGKNGRVHVNLDVGNYYAVEIETAKGFKLDNTPQYFEIKDGKTTTLTVENTPYCGIEIHKIDSVTGAGIYGAKFLLYDAEKHPVGEYVSDQDGFIYIDDLTHAGTYFIRELACEGYNVDAQEKTVTVKHGEMIQIEWKNTPITGQIMLMKFAGEANSVTGQAAGAPLQGATYEIVSPRNLAVVAHITTDARGIAASDPLPLGRYQIREVSAPAYWQVSSEMFDVTLEHAGQIIKLAAYDKPATLGVALTKTGLKEVLAGSQMQYTFTVANMSNVELDSFFLHDKLPYDVTTATAITTGTYSQRMTYRILYKTNMSEYRVLASNLLTTNNYAYQLSGLPLMAGEVVTDIYFDFGRVPAGFQCVAKPTLTVQASGTAVNGYQIINRADAGGQYAGTWETTNASWITVLVNLTPKVPLPKTGY